MTLKVVFKDGDKVPVFRVPNGDVNLMMVPFAKDHEEGLHAVATACTVFLPGHDDTRELSLGLIIKNIVTGEVYDYTLNEALERLRSEVWLPYCVVTSIAAKSLLRLERPNLFHIYLQSYRHDSQLGTMLGVVANAIKEDYELRRVDEYRGSVLWVGVSTQPNEVDEL